MLLRLPVLLVRVVRVGPPPLDPLVPLWDDGGRERLRLRLWCGEGERKLLGEGI